MQMAIFFEDFGLMASEYGCYIDGFGVWDS